MSGHETTNDAAAASNFLCGAELPKFRSRSDTTTYQHLRTSLFVPFPHLSLDEPISWHPLPPSKIAGTSFPKYESSTSMLLVGASSVSIILLSKDGSTVVAEETPSLGPTQVLLQEQSPKVFVSRVGPAQVIVLWTYPSWGIVSEALICRCISVGGYPADARNAASVKRITQREATFSPSEIEFRNLLFCACSGSIASQDAGPDLVIRRILFD